MIRFPLRTSATLALIALIALGAGPALAQTSSSATRLAGVTVTAPAPTLPKVVSTFPADGKTVTPGVLILKVTFDQKMNPDGWDYGKGADAYPQCLDRPRLLPDEKTFVLLCTIPSKDKFSLTFDASGSGGFENLAGQKATMAALNFATDDSKSIATIADAMKAAQLKPEEGPVMDSKPAPVAEPAPAPAQ
jgi:hypothetical protein